MAAVRDHSVRFRVPRTPLILAIIPVLFLAVDHPLTQELFLPPQETIEVLLRQSEAAADPAMPFVRDVVYHSDLLREYHLDVYGPLSGEPATGAAAGAANGAETGAELQAPAPVIIFYHGGSWLRGDKITIMVVERFLRRMREQGWFVVAVDYTTSALRGLAGPVAKARRALEWVQDQSSVWGWDPRRVGLYGVSAGAHVALMAAAEQGAEQEQPRPALVLAECAPVDLLEMRAGDAFEQSASFRLFPRSHLAALSPVAHIDQRYPPTLIYHGDADTTVHVDQALLLADELAAAGVAHDLVIYPEGGHAFLNYSTEQWYEQESRAIAWMAAVFRSGDPPPSSGPRPASMTLYH